MTKKTPADVINKQREAIKKAHGNSVAMNKKVNLMTPDEVTNLYLSLPAHKRI